MRNLQNNLYMIKCIWKASPERIILQAFATLYDCAITVVYDLFFMRFLIACMEWKIAFGWIAAVIAGYFALTAIGHLLTNYVERSLVLRSNVKIQEYLMDQVYRQALRVDLDCYEDAEFYDTYTRANEEIANRTNEILDVMVLMISIVFQVCGYAAAVLIYDPLIVPILLAAFLISRGFQSKFIKHQMKRDNEAVHQRRRMEYAKRVVYLQDYAKDLRLTNIFRPVMRNFHRAADEAREIAGYYGKRAAGFRLLATAVASLSVVVGVNALVVYRYLVMHAYSLGILTTVLNASNGLNDCLGTLVRISGAIRYNGLFIENYRKFIEYEPHMKEAPNAAEAQRGPHTLTLEHVGFHYRGSDKPVLSDINLEIPAGQTIALVGHNGAGKSTLVKLLMRLYDPTEGVIRMDGRDIREFKIKSYREQFGTEFQDFKIFAASVAENVLMRPLSQETKEAESGDRQRVEQALRDSGVWGKVETLPRGMDSMLTKEFDDDGALLSGGEQQKLAVARVFAGDSSIAILDEPSSALDPISEYELFDNLMRACKGKTVIFVSHRLSSATLADKIYLLEQGRIIEQGSHHELMEQGGKYAEMFRMQAENYRKKEED